MNDFVPATPFLQFPDSIKSPMLDLSALFGRFIHYRMGLDQGVYPKETYAPVSFKELTVRWGGMMGGILVLRASLLQLTQWFHNPQSQHLEYKDEMVLFNEMAVSFGIYLIQCTGLEDWENIPTRPGPPFPNFQLAPKGSGRCLPVWPWAPTCRNPALAIDERKESFLMIRRITMEVALNKKKCIRLFTI